MAPSLLTPPRLRSERHCINPLYFYNYLLLSLVGLPRALSPQPLCAFPLAPPARAPIAMAADAQGAHEWRVRMRVAAAVDVPARVHSKDGPFSSPLLPQLALPSSVLLASPDLRLGLKLEILLSY